MNRVYLKQPADCALWNSIHTVSIEVDERGESADYTAYNLVCRDTIDHIVWIEGIQKDRRTMLADWRAIVDPVLATLERR